MSHTFQHKSLANQSSTLCLFGIFFCSLLLRYSYFRLGPIECRIIMALIHVRFRIFCSMLSLSFGTNFGFFRGISWQHTWWGGEIEIFQFSCALCGVAQRWCADCSEWVGIGFGDIYVFRIFAKGTGVRTTHVSIEFPHFERYNILAFRLRDEMEMSSANSRSRQLNSWPFFFS